MSGVSQTNAKSDSALALRDRIASAACGATSAGKLFPWDTLSEQLKDSWRNMADAVIAELGLQVEITDYISDKSYRRYTSDWKADDE